ncbi:MAG: DUF6807 family protein [Bryobacterales bacterium]
MRKIALLLGVLAASVTLARAGVDFRQHSDRIEVFADGKPLTTLYFGQDAPKPYLHPLRAADGTIVSRQYPMRDDIPGEAHDHPHHRGMWFSHGDVNGFDFWASEPDQQPQNKKGHIVLKGVHKVGDGFIRADFEWRTPEGEVLLTDDRIYRFSVQGDNVIIDNDIHLTAETKPVTFGDTKEGVAIRIAPSLRETTPDKKPGKGVILSSTGGVGEKNTWGKAAPWVDYSGPIGSRPTASRSWTTFNPKHRPTGTCGRTVCSRRTSSASTTSSTTRIATAPITAAARSAAFDFRLPRGHPPGQCRGRQREIPTRARQIVQRRCWRNQAAEAAWAKAVTALDIKALKEIYDNELIYAHSTGAIESKDVYLGRLQSGAQKYDAIEYQKSTIRVHGDSAVSHNIVVMKGSNAAGPFDNRLMMMHFLGQKGPESGSSPLTRRHSCLGAGQNTAAPAIGVDTSSREPRAYRGRESSPRDQAFVAMTRRRQTQTNPTRCRSPRFRTPRSNPAASTPLTAADRQVREADFAALSDRALSPRRLP